MSVVEVYSDTVVEIIGVAGSAPLGISATLVSADKLANAKHHIESKTLRGVIVPMTRNGIVTRRVRHIRTLLSRCVYLPQMANTYGRVTFTDTDDDYLSKYIAKYNPQKAGRSGTRLYRALEEDAQGLWPWSTRHSWQSWRERYVKNWEEFDRRIARWQKKKGIVVDFSQVGRGKKRKNVAEHNGGSGKKAKQAHDAPVKAATRAPPRSQHAAEPLLAEETGPSPTKLAAGRRAKGPDLYAAEIYDSDAEDEEAEEDELAHNDSESPSEENDAGEQDDDSVAGREHLSDHEDVPAKDDQQHQNREQFSQPPIAVLSTSDRPLPELRLSPAFPEALTTSTPNQPRASQAATLQPLVTEQAAQALTHIPVSKQSTGSNAVSGRHSVEVPIAIQEPTPPISAADPRSPAPAFNPRFGHLDNARGGVPAPLPVQRTGMHAVFSPAGGQGAAAALASASGANKPANRTRNSHADEEEQDQDDGSFFADPTDQHVQSAPTAITSNVTRQQKPRAPPKVIEGPFVNSFIAMRRRGDAEQTESEDEEAWPPKRTAATRGNQTVKNEPLSQTIQGDAVPKASEPQAVKPLATMKSVPFGSRTSSGSSTAELLAAHTAKYARDNNHPHLVVDQAEAARQVRGRVNEAPQVEDRTRGRRRRHILPDIEPIDFGGHHPFSQVEPSFDSSSGLDGGDGPPLGSPFKTPAESSAAARQGSRGRLAPRSLAQLAGDPGVSSDELIQRAIAAASAPTLAPPPNIPGNRKLRAPSPENVFVVSDRENQGERRDDHRRQTIGGYEARSLISAARANIFDRDRTRPRRSLPSAMRSRPVSFAQVNPGSVSFDLTGSLDSPPSLSALDERIAKNLGVDTALRRMSDNYEYKFAFIKRLWGHLGDFQKTDRLLGVMKTAAEQAASEVLGEEGIDLSDAVDDVLPHSGLHAGGRSSGRAAKMAPEFQPKPVLEDYDSDYNPPESSRAGQFTRLERQGRREEALRREMRRASQGGFSPHKVRVRPMPSKDEGSPISKARHERRSLVDETRQEDRQETRDRGQQMAGGRVPKAEARRSAPKPVWGEEEGRMLRSKDKETFRLLEERMGKAEVRRHLKDLFP